MIMNIQERTMQEQAEQVLSGIIPQVCNNFPPDEVYPDDENNHCHVVEVIGYVDDYGNGQPKRSHSILEWHWPLPL
jgi:hypothetical protein